jgi:hypothetical protein
MPIFFLSFGLFDGDSTQFSAVVVIDFDII